MAEQPYLFARFDEHRRPIAFIDARLFSRPEDIPDDAEAITAEVYEQLLREPFGLSAVIGGQVVPYTPPPAEPHPIPLSLHQLACARLMVDGEAWEIAGVERSQGISGAFVADMDTAWVFLTDEQPDTNYIVMPEDGITKYTTHVEVTRPGLSELSFLVFRVQ